MTDALISACQEIYSFLDTSVPVCGVLLDLRKAFNSVNHRTLSLKLKSLPDSIYCWLISYLKDRIQSVRVGNYISTPLPVRLGVLQGSILGLIHVLFLIFINDITSLNFITSHNINVSLHRWHALSSSFEILRRYSNPQSTSTKHTLLAVPKFSLNKSSKI